LKQLGKAWETLRDKDKRAAYDREFSGVKQKEVKVDHDTAARPVKRKRRRRHSKTAETESETKKQEPKDTTRFYVRKEKSKEHAGSLSLPVNREAAHDAYPSLRNVDAIAYYEGRIDSIKEELDELDRLDMEDEDEMENAAGWEFSWQGSRPNWRVLHLEEQCQLREQHRRNSLEEIRMLWEDIRQIEEVNGVGARWV
jgi:curved DNA-binding protein CbpA